MDSDISLAFASPEGRSVATSSTPRDRISLRDYIVEVEIGAFQVERGATQRVQFNIVVEVARPGEPIHDDVDRIVSYDTLTDAIAASLAEERLNLLETLAERIAQRVLSEPRARRIFVRIEKLDRGPFRLGVEIVRERDRTELSTGANSLASAPIAVFVDTVAWQDPRFSNWLDQLEALGAPVILTLAAQNPPNLTSRVKQAQKRIELLEIEQSAWVLAGQDDRCLVVGTRTEFEYAAKTGQTTVWAPSKMVLDAVDNAPSDVTDPMLMLKWFGAEMEARAVFALSDRDLQTDGVVQVPLTDTLAIGA